MFLLYGDEVRNSNVYTFKDKNEKNMKTVYAEK